MLVGPVSFLLLGKSKAGGAGPLALLDQLVPVYEELLGRLADAGADWVQIDEPASAWDLPPEARAARASAYARLATVSARIKICLATYFGGLRGNLLSTLELPLAAVHLDLVRDAEQLDAALSHVAPGMMLSLGVIDGRNIWRADLEPALELLERAAEPLGAERLLVGPSCSLLHCPIDLDAEDA